MDKVLPGGVDGAVSGEEEGEGVVEGVEGAAVDMGFADGPSVGVEGVKEGGTAEKMGTSCWHKALHSMRTGNNGANGGPRGRKLRGGREDAGMADSARR